MSWTLPDNPFVGLRPFKTEETLLFFGRHEQTRELLQQLHKTRFLAVVGSSGCGKSSLIRAGLIPKLMGGFLVEDRDAWLVAAMKPGEAPLLHLTEEILAATGQTKKRAAEGPLAGVIRDEGIAGLLEYLAPHLENSDANLLLLVDQFEEIFRFSDFSHASQQREEAAQFVSIMLGLAEQGRLPIYVTMTMRSDYLGNCDAFLGLPEAMNRSQFLVPRLTRQQRREAIEGPVRLYQGKISNRLTDSLLNETDEARDDLPILQHALMRTWDHARNNGNADGTLDLEDYKAIGTVKNALSKHAEEALLGMDERSRSLAKQLFQALTEVDPGNRRIRRPIRLSKILAITGAGGEEIWPVIQKFRSEGRSFLVVSSENPDKDPLIDISHESLIRQWERLNRWVDEEVESAEIYRRLAATARRFQQGKAGYYRDQDLQIAVDWFEKRQPNAAWAERYDPGFDQAQNFLQESLEESEKNLAKQERSRRILQALVGILSLAVAIMLIVAVFAFTQRSIAQNNAATATAALVEVENQKSIAEIASTEAVEQKEAAETASALAASRAFEASVAKVTAEAAASDAIEQRNIAVELTFRLTSSRALSAAWSAFNTQPDLSLLLGIEAIHFEESNDAFGVLLAGLQRRIRPAEIVPSNEFQLDKTLFGHHDFIWSLAYSLDGEILASGSADDSIILWDASDGEPLQRLEGHVSDVLSVAFSPDDRQSLLASGSSDSRVILWDLDSGEPTTLGNHWNWVNSVAFHPDGDMLASGSADDTIQLWDVETREPIGEPLRANRGNVNSLDFSPDGNTLAAGYGDSIVVLWENIRNAENIRPSPRPLERVHEFTRILSVAYSPDGTMLAAGGSDGDPIIALWDTDSGERIAELSGHNNRVFSLSFNVSGTLLASSSSDTTIRIWDVAIDSPTFGQQVVEPLKGGIDWVLSVAFSPVEDTLASAGAQGRVLLWKQPASVEEESPATIKLSDILGSHNSDVDSLAFSQSGEELVSGSVDGEVIRWDVMTAQAQTTLQEHPDRLSSTVLSQYGDTLAAGAEDGSILLWDSRSGERLSDLQGEDEPQTRLSFFPNGRYLVSSDEAGILLWDIDAGVSKNFLPDTYIQSGESTSLAVSPDNSTFAAAVPDINAVILYDISPVDNFQELFGEVVHELSGHAEQVLSLAFSPSGDSLASGSADDNILIWNVASGQIRRRLLGHTGDVTSLAFSPDGSWLVSGSVDDSVILWDVATGKQIGEDFELHRSDVLQVTFSPDGKRMASADANNQVVLWDMDIESLLAMACELAGRNLSLQEWTQHLNLPEDAYRATCPQYPLDSPTATPTPGS